MGRLEEAEDFVQHMLSLEPEFLLAFYLNGLITEQRLRKKAEEGASTENVYDCVFTCHLF